MYYLLDDIQDDIQALLRPWLTWLMPERHAGTFFYITSYIFVHIVHIDHHHCCREYVIIVIGHTEAVKSNVLEILFPLIINYRIIN